MLVEIGSLVLYTKFWILKFLFSRQILNANSGEQGRSQRKHRLQFCNRCLFTIQGCLFTPSKKNLGDQICGCLYFFCSKRLLWVEKSIQHTKKELGNLFCIYWTNFIFLYTFFQDFFNTSQEECMVFLTYFLTNFRSRCANSIKTKWITPRFSGLWYMIFVMKFWIYSLVGSSFASIFLISSSISARNRKKISLIFSPPYL